MPKDLSQILIKETAADTNDVFNVLIWRGAKGGFAVAEHLINVLNISIPFHHVPRSLNSPSRLFVLSLCHSPPSLQMPFQNHVWQPLSPPPNLTRWTWRSARLCFYVSQTSSSQCVLNQIKIKGCVRFNSRRKDIFNPSGKTQLRNCSSIFTAQVDDVGLFKGDFFFICVDSSNIFWFITVFFNTSWKAVPWI